MPRQRRESAANVCFHVINRGNGRMTVFHKDGDYAAFLKLLKQANQRIPIRLLAYCLMPNHFHLVMWPRHEGDLSRWMQWKEKEREGKGHAFIEKVPDTFFRIANQSMQIKGKRTVYHL